MLQQAWLEVQWTTTMDHYLIAQGLGQTCYSTLELRHHDIQPREGHGFITVPDLQEVLQKLGEKLSPEETQVVFILIFDYEL